MATFGTNIYNSSGVLMVGIADRLFRFHSYITYSIPQPPSLPNPVTVTVTGMAADGTWLVVQSDPGTSITIYSGYFTVSTPDASMLSSYNGYCYVYNI